MDPTGRAPEGAFKAQDKRTAGEAGERRLAEQIGAQKQELGRRINRMEDRFDENHRVVTAGLAELKAEVGALSTKVDERSHPRRLDGAARSSAGADVVAGAVRETPDRYSTEEPKGKAGEMP